MGQTYCAAAAPARTKPRTTGMASRTPFTILMALPAVDAASIAFCAQGVLEDIVSFVVRAEPAMTFY